MSLFGRTSVRVGLLVVAGLGAAAGGILAGRGLRSDANRPSDNSAGALFVAPDSLELGDVWEESSFPWPVEIENRSTRDIEVKEFGHSCTCTSVDPPSLVVPAGEKCTVRLTLSLTPKRSDDMRLEAEFEEFLLPRLAGGLPANSSVRWKIHGRVHRVLHLEKPVLDFGRIPESAQPLGTRTSAVSTLVPVSRVEVKCNSPSFRASVCRRKDQADQFSVSVTPAEKLPVGPFHCDVTLSARLEDGQQVRAGTLRVEGTVIKNLRVEGRIISDIDVTPPTVVFGARAIGEEASETVTIFSYSGKQFEVEKAKASSGDITVQRLPGDPTGGAVYSIKQRIAGSGLAANSVVFAVRTEKGVEEIPVDVTYHGVAPARK